MQEPRIGMTRGLSVYLDAIRLLAALGVVLSHARTLLLPAMPDLVAGHGFECVAVFFVLSGFVIRFVSVERHEAGWKAYAVARLARIWPVAMLSFVVTMLCTLVGAKYGDQFYQRFGALSLFSEGKDLLKSVLFLNEIWFEHGVFGTNEPYWSLGFEVPYYILFALVLFLPRKVRIIAVLGWFALYGPKIAAYLPLWLLGVALYEYVRRRAPSQASQLVSGQIWPGMTVMLLSVAAYKAVRSGMGTAIPLIFLPNDYHELGTAAVYYTAVGLSFGLNIIGASMILRNMHAVPAQLTKAVQWLAGGSFTVYLTHLPIMVAAAAIWPQASRDARLGFAILLGILVTCYLLAELAERRKNWARHWLARLLDT